MWEYIFETVCKPSTQKGNEELQTRYVCISLKRTNSLIMPGKILQWICPEVSN